MTAAALPLRRTWIVEEFKRRSYGDVFMRVFRAVAPEQARVVAGQSSSRIYHALLNHLKTLLPIYEPVFGDWNGNWEGNDEAAQALDHGVPVEFYGFDELAISYEPSYDPALALVWWLLPYNPEWEGMGTEAEPYHARLDTALPAALKKHAVALDGRIGQAASRKWIKPPHGRQWKGVWAFLPDVYDYVMHNTGCQLLDYSESIVWEGGEMLPWDADEVKGLIADWKRAEPMWEGIRAVVTYVGDDRWRLLDLGLALTGDEATRQLLSEPKRKGKTLAQVFMQDARHA